MKKDQINGNRDQNEQGKGNREAGPGGGGVSWDELTMRLEPSLQYWIIMLRSVSRDNTDL
jgi:hypothetical protein